jgi:hypothetical protein
VRGYKPADELAGLYLVTIHFDLINISWRFFLVESPAVGGMERVCRIFILKWQTCPGSTREIMRIPLYQLMVILESQVSDISPLACRKIPARKI